jgi:FixJ family two-component response regulator
MEKSQIIFVVEDDQNMLRLIAAALTHEGLTVQTFSSAAEFLDNFDPQQRGCLLLDVELPGLSGLELQKDLLTRLIDLPVIFLTGTADVSTAVNAMKQGALDLLQKPFEIQTLISAVRRALEKDSLRHGASARLQLLRLRRQRLTPRELEVMDLVVEGNSNKQIAARLKLSSKTVEIHRSRVMRKMEAGSLAELVRQSIDLAGTTLTQKSG